MDRVVLAGANAGVPVPVGWAGAPGSGAAAFDLGRQNKGRRSCAGDQRPTCGLGYPAPDAPALRPCSWRPCSRSSSPSGPRPSDSGRLKRATLETLPRVRRSVYATAMVIQWGLIAVVAVLWVTTRRAWSELGLVPIPSPGLIGVLVGLAIVVVFIVRQRRGLLADEDGLELVRRRLRNIERMMPRTPGELRGFFALSVTAGVCEEILYRGYMIWYLTHFLGLIPAALVAAAVFGLGHSTRPARRAANRRGGRVPRGIYLVTGSLFVPMVVHALMDIHPGTSRLRRVPRRGPVARARSASRFSTTPRCRRRAGVSGRDHRAAHEGSCPRPLDVIVVGLGAMGERRAAGAARRGMRVIGARPARAAARARLLARRQPHHPRGVLRGPALRSARPARVSPVGRARRARAIARCSPRPAGSCWARATACSRRGRARERPRAPPRARAARRRGAEATLPAIQLPGTTPVGVWEPRAGVLRPEAAVAAFSRGRHPPGAAVRTGETVTSWRAHATGVSVTTTRGTHHAASLVLPAGARLGALVPELPPSPSSAWCRCGSSPSGSAPASRPTSSRSGSGSSSAGATCTASRAARTASRSRATTRARSPTPTTSAATSRRRRSTRCARSSSALVPFRQRPTQRDVRVHVHEPARRELPRRPSPGPRQRDGRERLLRGTGSSSHP